MKLIPGTFAQSYQKEIISQALDCHFKAEEENFLRPNSEIMRLKSKPCPCFSLIVFQAFEEKIAVKAGLPKNLNDF